MFVETWLTSRSVLRAILSGAGFTRSFSKPQEMVPTLITTGYQQHGTQDSLIGVLRSAGVAVLLDVRQLPLSRRSGFSKTALAEALQEAGIEYRHERALGNPKLARDLWRAGSREEGERLYREHISNGSAWAVDELGVALQRERTCILCFEADHRDCHRSVIVEELERRVPALVVEHL